MNAAQIITKFELYVGDTTELSSSEEIDLLNKIYQKICDDRPWEFLKKEATGTMTTPTTIAISADFAHFVENYNWTDNSMSTEINAKPNVIWITGSNGRNPVQIVNWSDRMQYINQSGFCYLDVRAGTIIFPVAQSSGATYSFDYKFFPPDLISSDTPLFPARFHHIIFHGMCVDDFSIQLFDKARATSQENQLAYNSYLADMSLWNANLLNN